MAKWQRIYSSDNPLKCEMVKSVLIENGLNPVLLNKHDMNYRLGENEVLVMPDEVIRAIKIMEDEGIL